MIIQRSMLVLDAVASPCFTFHVPLITLQQKKSGRESLLERLVSGPVLRGWPCLVRILLS